MGNDKSNEGKSKDTFDWIQLRSEPKTGEMQKDKVNTVDKLKKI